MKTVEEVCDFLRTRGIEQRTLDELKQNKVDSAALGLLSDKDLMDMGLKAKGDIVVLRDYCGGPSSSNTVPNSGESSKTNRRKDLLKAVRDAKSSRGSGKVKALTLGRPKQKFRTITVGLRLAENQESACSNQFQTIQSPLGDKNFVSLKVALDTSYESLLKAIVEILFPGGQNPVVGNTTEFEKISIVNGHCKEVNTLTRNSFTLEEYLDERHVPGAVRFYLMCTIKCSGTDVVGTDDLQASGGTVHGIPCESALAMAFWDDGSAGGDIPDMSPTNRPKRSSLSRQAVETEVQNVSFPVEDVNTSGDNAPEESVPTPGPPPVQVDENFTVDVSTLDSCVQYMIQALSGITDATTIIKFYQSLILMGRPLDLASESETIEGEVCHIYISRYSILDDCVDELAACSPENLRYPLEVTFNGETAKDVGGVRREFLSLSLQHLTDRVCKKSASGLTIQEDAVCLANRYYFFTGLLMGLCVLQNGLKPCILENDLCLRVLGISAIRDGDEEEKQLRAGLDYLGFGRLAVAFPSLANVFTYSDLRLTHRRIVETLVPQFGEEGSNMRREEERVYGVFISYLREVTAGRRSSENGTITLEEILQFVTGSPTEPPLGYPLKPSLEFKSDESIFPTANTCICRLRLPVHADVLKDSRTYDRFDQAFSSKYFGRV